MSSSTSTSNKSSEASEIALSCPICMENYSTARYPIVSPECGHSICVNCGKKRNSNVCVTCESDSCCARYHSTESEEGSELYSLEPLPSGQWKKNFALLDLVDQYAQEKREKQRLAGELSKIEKKYKGVAPPNNIDSVICFNCKSKEKRERMKICGTCAEKWNKEWKGMEEKKIRPFIICGFCCVEEHYVHSFVKYLPWKLKSLVTTTVSDGKSTVFSMDELCVHEIEKGKEQLGKWNEKMDSFVSIDCKTYRDGLSIVDSLKNESDLVCRASEDTLPTLRMYTKVVTDSISRLDLLKNGESESVKKEWK